MCLLFLFRRVPCLHSSTRYCSLSDREIGAGLTLPLQRRITCGGEALGAGEGYIPRNRGGLAQLLGAKAAAAIPTMTSNAPRGLSASPSRAQSPGQRVRGRRSQSGRLRRCIRWSWVCARSALRRNNDSGIMTGAAVGVTQRFMAALACVEVDTAITVSGTLEVTMAAVGG